MSTTVNPEIIIVTSISTLNILSLKMKQQIYVAIDTETDGLSRFRKAIGISFAFDNTCFYIPLLKWDGSSLVNYWDEFDADTVHNQIIGWLKDPSKRWIGHNIVFDTITIQNAFGVDIVDQIYSDTALLHHTCISEDPPHGLKPLAIEYLDPDADKAQEDLEASVIANGGVWKKDQKEFFKGDVLLLAKYGALDPFYTLKLHNLWYPEIEKQGLQNLWNNEVFPLIKVMKELNSTGLCVDIPYFISLKEEVQKNVDRLEELVIRQAGPQLEEFEFSVVLEKTKITPRSELGKLLAEQNLTVETGREVILNWYKKKHNLSRIFSLTSKDHLAFLLYDVLKLPVLKMTKGNSRATDKSTLDELLEESASDSEILKAIKERSKELKLLNTYIEPILENQINGRIYPQFNQIGTSSGRFTSSEPINFQTLPRDDLRIKKGFKPDDGWVIVNADFSSLEPRIFAHISNEPEIKRVYSEGLDLYSHVYKMVMNDDSVSAREEDPNFLKKVNPLGRNQAKAYTLGFAYGMTEYKYASTMGVSVEDAAEIKDKYFEAFKNLKNHQADCKKKITTQFYVSNLMGRKRRAKLLPLIQKKYRVSIDDYRRMAILFDKIQTDEDYIAIADKLKKKGKPIKSLADFRYAIKNEINNSFNFPIQGLAASVANASCIKFQQLVKFKGISAKLVLQVHDEITVLAKKEDAEIAAKCLQEAMEHNLVTEQLSVPMIAEPIIALNLSEAK